jgi:hypothetical protein
MKISKIIILVMIATGFVACQGDYEAEMVPGHELAGEWFVETSVGGTVVLGHERIMTYNLASATGDSIWFDDLGHIWPVRAKISANPGGASFNGTNDNLEVTWTTYDTADIIRDPNVDPIDSVTVTGTGYETVTIVEGKIMGDAASSKTGVTADSIYIKATFSDDPGTEYEIAGHRRTGFVEDDY